MAATIDYFDSLYGETDDPWGFRSRWYEQRKQSVLLGCLDKPRYESAFEPACANGELAAALAPRCRHLLASDFHPPAIALARKRLAGFRQVTVERRTLPSEWPDRRFDLVVIGEIGYYLGDASLREVVARSFDSLTDAGSIVACHWRHPIANADLSGDEVHAIIGSALGWPPLVAHREIDFVVELWSRDTRSVAAREGLA